MMIRSILAACVLLVLGQTVAADPVTIRGSQGDGYGRLTFTWPAPVPFVAKISNRRLIVHFSRPLESNLRGLPGRLSKYLGRPCLSGGGRTITFPLNGEFDLNYTSRGRVVTVDVMDLEDAPPSKAASSKPAAPKPPARQAQKPPSAPAPAKTAVPPPANVSENVKVRTGQHEQYGRLVFDWAKNVNYSLDRQGNRASFNFQRPANINVAPLNARSLSNVAGAETVVGASKSTVVLKVASTSRIRHFRSGSKVVVDVFNPTGRNDANGPPPASFKPPQVETAAATPPAKSETSKPSPKPQGQSAAKTAAPEKSSTPAQSASKQTTSGTTSQSSPSSKPVALSPGASQPPASPVTKPQAAAPETKVADGQTQPAQKPPAAKPAPARRGGGSSVRLDFKDPVAAAVFRRAGLLWLIFDQAQKFDTAKIKADGGNGILSVNQVSAARGTFLRIATEPGVNPAIRRDGNAWIFDFKKQGLAPATSIETKSQPNSQSGPRLFLPIPQAGGALAFHDAEVGDNLIVVPVTAFSHGMKQRQIFPQLNILPTAQGLVFQPKIDDLRVQSSTQGVEVTSTSRLTISPLSPKMTANAKIASLSSIERIFKPDVWRKARREGMKNFRETRRELLDKVAAAPGPSKQSARMNLAIYLVGQNFAYESLGVLKRIHDENQDVEASPRFRLLRGASNYLMGRFGDAEEDLNHPTLDDTDEGEFWRAINQAGRGNLLEAAPILKGTGTVIRSYPKRIKMPLGLLIANAAVAAGDLQFATNYLKVVSEEEPSPKEVDQLALIEGDLQKLAGNFDGAVEAWEATAEGDHRPSVVRAIVRRAELLLQQEKIKPKEAINELENLRFSWRGDEFEFNLLRNLGQLYLDSEDYRNGLRTLRAAASYFRNNPLSPEVTQDMAGAFADLYLNDSADSMPPVRAIALFDEFKELTPSGEKGDEMIRKLADRLAQVDLLDRAAKLLAQQVNFRLKGVEKARVGARLATVRLLNRQPAQAADALRKSDAAGLSPELAAQRRQLLARALIDEGRQAEAIVLLENDESREADLLKTEVYWKAKDWPNASKVFQRLVKSVGAKPGKPLDERQALYVLNLGVSLALGGNERGSVRLLQDYGPAMEGGPYKDAFNLIASPDAVGLLDFRTVASKVKTVAGFRTYMADYKKRLKEGKLSELN